MVGGKVKVAVETEILNDYKYLKNKDRAQRERARSPISTSSASHTSYSRLSYLTNESDQSRIERKWEKVIKAGMETDHAYLNSYAHWMI